MTTRTYAVFPFLKTTAPVVIGPFLFRSTDDTEHLDADDRRHLDAISEMLFLQDDLRIVSGSYCMVPFIDVEKETKKLADLIDVHGVIAYRYAAPHPVSGDLFLTEEHASIALFSPQDVSIFAVSPDHHVFRIASSERPEPNERHEVPGYAGLYNFTDHFYVTKGSRLYGPRRHLTLNISQDLHLDFDQRSDRTDYSLLLKLLTKRRTETCARILTAIRWFNAANHHRGSEDARAIVNLAIAFETLLGIPEEEKKTGISDRITEAISLLLGRTPRLDTWARQFYKTRSEIVHQGKAGQMRFVAPSSKKGEEGALYHPLLSFGRQLFQMCASVLLVGERIAETAGLEDKLVTNQERFEHLCRILSDEATSLDEKIATSNPIIFAIERYRYVGESNLRIETMLAAARFVAAILAESDSDLPVALRTSVAAFARTGKSLDHFDELETLKRVKESIPSAEDQPERPWRVALRHLVEVVWGLAFMHYYWLKQKRETSVGN